MKYPRLYCLLSSILFLSACGSSDKSDVEIPIIIAPEPSVTLQVSTAEQQFFSNEGDAIPVVFEGTWSASNLGSNSVYIQAIDEEGNIIKTAISESLEEESFTLHTAINHTLEVGDYTSTVSLVACKDSSCNSIYDNSNASVDVQINVKPVPEWQTHQGNAAHNGYVPIWLNHYEFEKLWEWQYAGYGNSINAPVSGNGEVFVTSDMGMDNNAIVALDALTGEERWRIRFGNLLSMNPPAINRDTLFVSTSNVGDNKIWAIDRAEGSHKFQANFDSVYGGYFAPTIHDDVIYHTGGGYQGGSTFAFEIYDGAQVWSQSQGSSFGADTPAVDNEHVYVHDGGSLSILDKSSGELIRSIDDTFGIADYSYWGSPVVGSSNNVLAFARGNAAGTPNTSVEHLADRVISNFDIESAEYRWSSEFSYKTFFATSNGVVYAGRNPPRTIEAIDETTSLDAIDETTGEILWSWVAPSSEDESFHRNVVVTKNLLFVSTNAHIYAIDLDSKQAVWSYDEPGVISISDDRILFLATGESYSSPMGSNGRLIAFDLRSK
jgi:outer membrane protein assembly factor BamB